MCHQPPGTDVCITFKSSLMRGCFTPAVFTLELLAERVVPVPLDGSTVVEGTIYPTTASSPNADIRGILATRLEKAKHKSANRRQKYSIVEQLATHLSLVVWEEPQCFLATHRVPLVSQDWVPVLGGGWAPYHSSTQLLPHLHNQNYTLVLFIWSCIWTYLNLINRSRKIERTKGWINAW